MSFIKIKGGLLKVADPRDLPEFPGEGGPPDWGIEGGGDIDQGLPGRPERPARPIFPTLPPWLKPGVGLPIPPTPEYPMVPIPPSGNLPELPPGTVWPPLRPEFPPDFGNKYLVAALIWVSGKGYKAHWVVVDLDSRPGKPPEWGLPEGERPEVEPPEHPEHPEREPKRILPQG
jgi:hypothetical protein